MVETLVCCVICKKERRGPLPIRCRCGQVIGQVSTSSVPSATYYYSPAHTVYPTKNNATICRTNNCGHYNKSSDTCQQIIDLAALKGQTKAGYISYIERHPQTNCPAESPQWPRNATGPDHFPTLAAPWVEVEDLITATKLLLSQLIPLQIARIVGVPRSGMIAASFLATALNVELWGLHDGELQPLSSGLRLRDQSTPESITLVVEDSSASGDSINEVKSKFADRDYKYAAVLVTPQATQNLDYWGKILPLPHWFAWNLYGNQSLSEGFKISTDIDGILNPDCLAENDDDGPRYLAWMRSVKPLIRNNYPFKAIITARLEKYRSTTETWLTRNNILYDRLIMYPSESLPRGDVIAWKREQVIAIGSNVYIESDPHQACEMSRGFSGTILCPPAKTSFYEGKPA